jgi:hypothetical protein
MPTLRDLQGAFAAQLLDTPATPPPFVAGDAIPAASRLAVYRNNSRSFFDSALRATYPVVERRVGTDYFKQLCLRYREVHPSSSGDLHGVGRNFAAFLAEHLADSPYVWLAELAALEWAIADSAVSADSERLEIAALQGYPPDELGALRFTFVPSAHLLDASVPVLTVWRANQGESAGGPIDLSTGGECVVVHRAASNDVEMRRVALVEFRFLRALESGRPLGDAIEESELTLETLPRVLKSLFEDGLVAAINS